MRHLFKDWKLKQPRHCTVEAAFSRSGDWAAYCQWNLMTQAELRDTGTSSSTAVFVKKPD